jgi:hypothetical protein
MDGKEGEKDVLMKPLPLHQLELRSHDAPRRLGWDV